LHGETSLLPWNFEIVKDDQYEISVKLSTTTVRTPFKIEKILTMKSKDSSLYIDETVYNDSYEDLDVMWGHHPALGFPFLDDSCEIYAPAKYVQTMPGEQGCSAFLKAGQKSLWPLCEGVNGQKVDISKIMPMDSRKEDMAFLLELEKGEYKVFNRSKGIGFAMEWDKDLMPYLWFWMIYGGSVGYPWYGNAYVMALEPWTSLVETGKEGLNEAIRMGNSLNIKAHRKISTSLRAYILDEL
jgi:galactose mutarotase-like enzyme